MLILLSICLIANPSSCREERLNLSIEQQQGGPMACLMQAQPAIAQWQLVHTQWHVERWRCTTAGALQTDI